MKIFDILCKFISVFIFVLAGLYLYTFISAAQGVSFKTFMVQAIIIMQPLAITLSMGLLTWYIGDKYGKSN